MARFKDLLKQREAELERKIRLRPAEIDQGLSQTRDFLGTLDTLNESDVSGVLSRTGSRLGLPSGTVEAGASAFRSENPKATRRREDFLSFRRSKEFTQHLSNVYNRAVSAYMDAGFNVKQSENFARDLVRQAADRKFRSDLSSKQREFLQKRQGIAQDFEDKQEGITEFTRDPLEEAMIRSITGLLPYAYLGFTRNK